MDASPSVSADPREVVVSYLGRVLEALWLIAAVAVPLAVVPPDAMVSAVSVPKVTVLRVVASLVAIVWLVEWALSPASEWGLTRLRRWRPRPWLLEDPARWIIVGVVSFAAVNVLTAVTSVAPSVSVWGDKPGDDGYDLYTMLCYATLFLVIATHLKRPEQLWRLLGAVAVAGTVAATFVVLQHVGLEPILSKGNVLARPPGHLGNPVYAGALLLMTSLVTLTAIVSVYLRRGLTWLVVVGACLLGVQLLGQAYALSRGPWVGMAVGVVLFALLVLMKHGARPLTRFGIVAFVTVAAVALIVFAIPQPGGARSGRAVAQHAVSIVPQIAGGGVSGRVEIWQASLELIRQRPWADVTRLTLPWARQVVGYGPETFRYFYPLRSPSRPTADFPFEAHNYPLHVTVEMGAVGLVGLLGLAAAIVGVGAWRLRSGWSEMSPAHGVILAGLLATFIGRGVEMLAGIPRAADLTLVALLLGAFVYVCRAVPPTGHDKETAAVSPPPREKGSIGAGWGWLLPRLIVVFSLIVVLGVFTSVRAVNYARADMVAADAMKLDQEGGGIAAIQRMLEANELALDVSEYLLEISRMFGETVGSYGSADAQERLTLGQYVHALRAKEARELEPTARAAMASGAVALHLIGQEGRLDEAVQLAQEVLAMMPNFAISHYSLAPVSD